MRWFSERSGAVPCLGESVESEPAAGGMGGESTPLAATIKARRPNFHEAQVER
jgi:hypothetical protein